MKVNTKQRQLNAKANTNANANFRALSIEDCIEMMAKNRSSLPEIDI